jgi:hypothetical protein
VWDHVQNQSKQRQAVRSSTRACYSASELSGLHPPLMLRKGGRQVHQGGIFFLILHGPAWVYFAEGWTHRGRSSGVNQGMNPSSRVHDDIPSRLRRICVSRFVRIILAKDMRALKAAQHSFAQWHKRVPCIRADGPRHLGVIWNDCFKSHKKKIKSVLSPPFETYSIFTPWASPMASK